MPTYSIQVIKSNFSNKQTITVTGLDQINLYILKPQKNLPTTVANFLLLFKLPYTYNLYNSNDTKIAVYTKIGKTSRTITNLQSGKITSTEIERTDNFFKAVIGDEILISREPSQLEIRKDDSLIGLFKVESNQETIKQYTELIRFTEFQKVTDLQSIILLYFNEIYYSR